MVINSIFNKILKKYQSFSKGVKLRNSLLNGILYKDLLIIGNDTY